MANRHFAALGDVWKHLPLAELLRANPPRHYWETHAGSAQYLLSGSPARLHGAIRFLTRAPSDPDLAHCAYLEVLRAVPGKYPGSPSIAMQVLGCGASYVFCDIDPESVRDLRAARGKLNVRVIDADGVREIAREAVSAKHSPHDVFVHIDPYLPYERLSPNSQTPVELAASLARSGHRVMYWYGYDEVSQQGWARHEITQMAPGTPLWCGDVLVPSPFVYPERPGAWGCGIVLANMTNDEADLCGRLGRALERASADDVLASNEPDRFTFRVVE
jgi:23S rRNA A2030 N6-methylase RlmJ